MSNFDTSISSIGSAEDQRAHDESSPKQSSPATESKPSDTPNRDSEKHPKGKRKRTAAKDKSVLETAYQANPKPDKAARLDLVQRVSLNEKEVQIWFQNRRQNDRRKSRPLSPQEIAALRSGGMQILSSDPMTSSSQPEEKTSPVQAPGLHSFSASSIGAVQIGETQGREQGESQASQQRAENNKSPSPSNSQGELHHPQSTPISSLNSSIGYLSNRWNISGSFSTPSSLDNTARFVATPPLNVPDSFSCSHHYHRFESFLSSSPPQASAGSAILPPPKSQVRLSLSLEGKAEIVSNDQSPQHVRHANADDQAIPIPRLSQERPRSLQRSRSTASNVTLPSFSTLTGGLPPSLGRGRSRDAQAWELCCESDQRDELTTQAENESNGSAVAAISLLRSTSGILQPNSTKRNASPVRSLPKSQQGKKPRLSRAMSSHAVLEQCDAGTQEEAPRSPDAKLTKLSVLLSPGGDSDKENWSPDEEGNPRRGLAQRDTSRANRAAGPAAAPSLAADAKRSKRTLQESRAPGSLKNSRANTAPVAQRRDQGKPLEIFEDSQERPSSVESEDVERFMRGEVSPSKKGDMDCIAGLLSLSQGNWR